MKKSIFIALIGAAVLGLTSCTTNNSSSSVSSSSSSSSTVSSSSSSSSSTSTSTKAFTDEELGLIKGHFIGENYELDISASSPRLLDLSYESYQDLSIIDIKTEKYTSTTLTDSETKAGLEFDVDYVYLKENSTSFRYRVFIPKEENASLSLERLNNGKWSTIDSLYPWDDNFVGTWATTVSTAGFVRTAVFSDEFIQPFSDSDIKVPTGYEYYGKSIWYPQFVTSLDYSTGEYKTYSAVLAYDANDFSYPMATYRLGESTDPNYPISIYDTSWDMEYYYPSAEYYKGSWYTSDGQLTISEGENAGEFIYNGKTYSASVNKEEGYGWATTLTADGETISLHPFVGGFSLEKDGTALDAVKYNPDGLVGTWLYNNSEIKVFNDYDDDWNEVLKVTVDGNEVAHTFAAKDKQFAIGFEFKEKQAYLTPYFDNSVAVLDLDGDAYYTCSKEIYQRYFVNAGQMYSSNTVGDSKNVLDTLEVLEDYSLKLNGVTYDVDYGFDEEKGVVSLKFYYEDVNEYSLYVYSKDIFLLEKSDEDGDYSIFATKEYLDTFVSDWTKRGEKASLVINSDYTVTTGNVTYSTVFDYDESSSTFFLFYIDSTATTINALEISEGTLIAQEISLTNSGAELLSTSWYIKTEDYKKIEGTYVYIGEKGKEYVIVDDSEVVKITTNVNGEYVLKEYTGDDNLRFSYYNDQICLTFRDDNSGLFIYIYTDGVTFNFFDQFHYIQSALVDNQGYFTDGTNVLSIGGKAIYYNGTKVTLVSAQGDKIVFTVSGVTYTATISGSTAVVSGGESDVTLTKGDFDLKNFAGTWTDSGTEYTLTTTEKEDGSLQYSFTFGATTLTDYQVSVEDGKTKVTFSNLSTIYTITLGDNGETTLTVTSSIPLPPPPPPLL